MSDRNNKISVLAIVGPTASGKTKLAVEMAKLLNGEIISADSMQIYKYMNIGTAKPNEDEKQGIPHHLMDFLEPTESFSVADYVKLAKEKIFDIHTRGKLPIIAGGTGLYVDSLLNNIDFGEMTFDEDYRKELEQIGKEQGGKALLTILREFDPSLAETLHENNIGRIIRGIEVYKATGIPMSQHQINARNTPSLYNSVVIGLSTSDRAILYDRINNRVDVMLEQGLLEETKRLINNGFSKTALQAIGYKELFGYINGDISLEQACENLKRATRRYAKRQLTWFRRNKDINWIYCDDNNFEQVLNKAKNIWQTKLNCSNI